MAHGRFKDRVPVDLVQQHLLTPLEHALSSNDVCYYHSYIHRESLTTSNDAQSLYVLCNFSLNQLSPYLSRYAIIEVCNCHGIPYHSIESKTVLYSRLYDHSHCPACDTSATVICIDYHTPPPVTTTHFPPDPPTERLMSNLIQAFCSEFDPEKIEEVGCAVCGQLRLKSSMRPLSNIDLDLSPIQQPLTAKQPWSSSTAPEWPIESPILDDTNQLCQNCYDALSIGKRPHLALANRLWIGVQPRILKELTFVEQLLIARVRHNKCLVRIASSGRAKMSANAIMFQSPTAQVYTVLPPSRETLSEVLAYIFIEHAKPTVEDFKKTPMLVRKRKIREALEWLKLNHIDYVDLKISETNLNIYLDEGLPVVVEHCPFDGSINPLATSLAGEEALD
ncbi:hypothetical protein Agabi119p4_5104 [Agaricus bisporus var. burnettii]|uniref:DUF6570 domain-containing protein n=1 Tax=Agaricus bisporus var. burnettii TaxID=192524 RepID=A0A8H7F4K8_AGABI|nr:hypothetical protein Agabi119p4_5104 [Agaricus bisporus var. burnettii]